MQSQVVLYASQVRQTVNFWHSILHWVSGFVQSSPLLFLVSVPHTNT